MTFSSPPRDAAVSPIIATILLVVLTVTVIAVAAVVVIDISEGYGDQKTVDIRVSPSGDYEYKVVVTGGADAAELTSLSAHVDGVTFESGGDISDPEVGLPGILAVARSDIAGEALMTLIGTFTDGTVQLVYEGRVEVGTGGTGNLPKPVPTTAKPTEDKGGDTPGVGGSGGEDIPPISKEDIWADERFTLNPNKVMLWDTAVPIGEHPEPGAIYHDGTNAYRFYIVTIPILGWTVFERDSDQDLKDYAQEIADNGWFSYVKQIDSTIRFQSDGIPSEYKFKKEDSLKEGNLYLDTSTKELYVCISVEYIPKSYFPWGEGDHYKSTWDAIGTKTS